MVKVAENRVVDLDLFPGDTRGDKLAERTRAAIAGKVPQDEAKGLSANTQNAAAALGGTLGGGVKGVVDTLGNTVGSLGEGVTGTVQGVGDGLGSTLQFAGGALGAGAGKIGGLFGGNTSTQDAVEADHEHLQKATDAGRNVGAGVKETGQKTADTGATLAQDAKEKVAGSS